MKLDQDGVTRICARVFDHEVSTQIVADPFDVNVTRRPVQQLAKQYRDAGDVAQLDTAGREPYADHPDDLADRVLAIHDRLGVGAVAHVLCVRDDLSIATNTVHEILKANDTVTENPTKQIRRRPWVCFEYEYSLVTVHMDW